VRLHNYQSHKPLWRRIVDAVREIDDFLTNDWEKRSRDVLKDTSAACRSHI